MLTTSHAMTPMARAVYHWAPRVAFMALVVAAPWPFGSVTPLPASILTASTLVLLGIVIAHDFLAGKCCTQPGLSWALLGVLVVAFQQTPLPPKSVEWIAPAVESVYEPLRTDLEIHEWHPLTVEPFQSRWSLLHLLGLVSAFYLAARLFQRGPERYLLAYAIAGVGVALSLFAVYQKARWGTVLYGSFPVPSATPFGPFVNHNHFAGFVEGCGLVALGTALGSARRSGSLALLLGGAAGIMGIALVASHSRGGLLAASAGLVVLAWLSRSREKRTELWLVAGGLALVSFLLVFAPLGLFQRFTTLANPAADDSVRFRLTLWSDSVTLASASPLFGTGLGTYAAAIPPYRSDFDETRAEYAESDWLQLLCETGLLGVVLVGGFLFTVVRRGVRSLEDEPSERARGVAHGALAAVVALVAHGVYDFNFRIPSNALLTATLLGVLAARSPKSFNVERTLYRYGGATLLLVVSIVVSAYTLRVGTSRDLTRHVDPLLVQPEEFTRRIQELSQSQDRVPDNPQTAYLLGRLYNEEAYRSHDAALYRDIRFEQAAEAFRQSLRLAPARGRYWFELAWTEANRRNDELADRLFTRALTLEPQLANLRANYALYLGSRGRIDEAIEQLEWGRRLRPGLDPMDALNVIAPYVGEDPVLLRRAAGTGAEAERALMHFRKSRAKGGSE